MPSYAHTSEDLLNHKYAELNTIFIEKKKRHIDTSKNIEKSQFDIYSDII